MADELDDLLAAREQSTDDVDTLLAGKSEAPQAAASPDTAPATLPWYRSAATGAIDPLAGAGQLMQHIVPDSAMNVARKSVGSIAAAIPGVPDEFVQDLMRPRSTADVDQFTREREEVYQGERGGDKSMDWWRVAGSLANPVTWLSPSSKVSGFVSAVKAGAKAGAFQALLQPVTSDGNFLWSKGTQSAIGAGAGGTLSGAMYGLQPALKFGVENMRKAIGANAPESAYDAAAEKIVKNVTDTAADGGKIDPDVYSAMRQEVADALKAGVEPSADIMTRRADAAALPIPVHMTRAQLSRDPMLFAWEQRVAGQQGVGEPLSDLLSNQNRALIQNLNKLGAEAAPSPYQASEQVIKHLEGVDQQMSAHINDAYSKVRDAAGRSARVSNEDFATIAKDRLTGGRPGDLVSLADYLPENVAKQFNDIMQGKLPLTVDNIQFLDRAWGGVQRGAGDDTTKLAIGKIREALNETPVTDSLGDEAMQAYKQARALAAARFKMMRENPAFQAVVDGKAEPDKFFSKYVESANVSELKGLKGLLGADNTKMLQDATVGQLKRAALSKASDENGVFSQAAYNRILQDPVRGPRIQELFSDSRPVLDQLYRVGRVSENLIKIPAASKVNTSNTASATANIVRDVAQSEVGGAVTSMLPNWMQGLGKLASGVAEKVKAPQAVQDSVSGGVTVAPVKATQQSSTSRLSDLLARGAGAAAASQAVEEDRE